MLKCIEIKDEDLKQMEGKAKRVITAEMRHKYYIKHYYTKKQSQLVYLNRRLEGIERKEIELKEEKEEVLKKIKEIKTICGEVEEKPTASEPISEDHFRF